MATVVAAVRHRIIRRPRLTSMLDESSAQIRLLIAPAGYGKTTLAREWLGEPERRYVWYRGGLASADVAALAAGFAEAASEIIPDAGKRMRDRVRATGHPEEEVDILAELFAEDVQDWPSDAWLAFDDYQFTMESVASERFLDLMTQQTPIQMLITSRRRPSWATARRILYGEILEIDRRALAMEDAEARAVLGRKDQSTAELIARARGWPAVLGLAALTNELEVPEGQLPEALYDYLAQELLQAVNPAIQRALVQLATFPALSLELTSKVLGDQARIALHEGTRIGAFARSGDDFELHPLLRDFLISKLKEQEKTEVRVMAENTVALLVSERRWDEAFQVIATLETPDLVSVLIGAALDELLREGRVQTIAQWLEFAEANHIATPVVDLAESEVAFRQGHYAKAETLALAASERLMGGDLNANALIRAGQAAMLDSRDLPALQSFRDARLVAHTDRARLDALVGEYFASLELGLRDDAEEGFAEICDIAEGGVEMRVRQMRVQLVRAARLGGITHALQSARAVFPLLERIKEPLVVSSFLNAYAHLLALNTRYEEALELSGQGLKYAKQYRLDFVLPHSSLVMALAYSGIREFTRALQEIEAAEEEARRSGDMHVVISAATLRARIAIHNQDFDTALKYTCMRWERPASAATRAEVLAHRCVAAACVGDIAGSTALAGQTRAIPGLGVEATALTACADAIAAVCGDTKDTSDLLDQALEAVEGTGAFDCFVTAARGFPEFVAALLGSRDDATAVVQILRDSNDFRLAHQVGLKLDGSRRGPAGRLTPRELEVARLVARGHTNQVIAGMLFISPSTVKVHVRHILEKLSASSRAEVAARMATLD
jgi:LuxR family transcriptional regulator, maltose regulon positive regulatory protein